MRKFAFFIFLFLISFALKLNAEYFYIEKYNVSVLLQRNSSAYFKEDILVNFHTARHGIFRYIPLVWHNHRLRIKLISLLSSRDGIHYHKERFRKWKANNWFYLKIGRKNKTIKGLKYYRIIYVIKNAIINDTFYWNIIGTGWKVPIKQANIKIYLPENINEKEIKFNCYKGKFGSIKQIPLKADGNILLTKNISLNPKEGITVKIYFPSNTFIPIPKYKVILWWFSDNFGFFIPIIALLIVSVLWFYYGKDEEKGTIVVQYKPPKNYTPAELGTLIDDRVDKKDIAATVVDLAVRGYLKIEKSVEEGLFFTKKDKFILIDTNKDPSHLKNHEKILHFALFKKGKRVDISELKKDKNFYKEINRFKDSLYNYLSKKEHLYTVNPKLFRYSFLVVGFLCGWFGIFIGNITHRTDIIIGLLVSGGIFALFSLIMPQKSHKGTLIYRKILGFKEFLEKVEKDRLKKLSEEDPDIFSKMLPFAIAFGVEKKWAKKFEGFSINPPAWYHGYSHGGVFSTHDFVNSLQNDISSLSSSLGSSVGGGATGGGAGGGGGGSW